MRTELIFQIQNLAHARGERDYQISRVGHTIVIGMNPVRFFESVLRQPRPATILFLNQVGEVIKTLFYSGWITIA